MILIKNGLVIDPANNIEAEKDILVDGAVIKAIENPGQIKAEVKEEIDAKGKWVTPGMVDVHVHFREPGEEWKETVITGAKAAAHGGFTTVCTMPNTTPAIDSAEVAEFILKKSKIAGMAKVLPIGAVSLERKGKQMAPLSELRDAGCIAFSDDGDPIYDAGLMRRALEWSLMLDAVIACHEEDKSLSCCGSMNESPLSQRMGIVGMPKIAEDVMVARDIELARVTGGKVHVCHISSERGVELIRRAKNDGIKITTEVTPHHLSLSEECVKTYDTNYKMSPPLRDEKTIEALHEGLKDGTIDCIASDHAPHETDVKLVEFEGAAMGIIGMQSNLPVMLKFVHEGTLSKTRFVDSFSTAPARIFGIDGAGTLKVGTAADICVLDPNLKWTLTKEHLKSKTDNCPFIDQEFQGIADTVLVDGQIVVRDQTKEVG